MRFLLISFLLFSIGCNNSDPAGNEEPPAEQEVTYQAVDAFPSLSFDQPVDLQHPDDGSGRLFVVENAGIVRVFENDSSANDAPVFLDITDRVDDSGTEEGLLGLAFHPDFEENGYFYVNYTASNPDRTIISRFQVSEQNTDQAEEASEQEILTFDQPYSNHNGGQLAFGPDGYLFIAVGDGGAGDPQENGQDRSTLLGSILRIDVDGQENGNNYAIPPDNPFAENGEGYREEIYAYGLRNPWRFSFDEETNRLWAADVGQNEYEEINIIESGKNYGWNIMEGMHCFDPPEDCDQSGLELPVWEYDHSEGISVTGGFVYRGPTLENLTGRYIYGDYGSGKIWALEHDGSEDPENTELLEVDFQIPSFGTDANNELYILGFDGDIYRFEEISE